MKKAAEEKCTWWAPSARAFFKASAGAFPRRDLLLVVVGLGAVVVLRLLGGLFSPGHLVVDEPHDATPHPRKTQPQQVCRSGKLRVRHKHVVPVRVTFHVVSVDNDARQPDQRAKHDNHDAHSGSSRLFWVDSQMVNQDWT
jgi:hypothetical protein